MLTVDVYRVIHDPAIATEFPWIVVNIARGMVEMRCLNWSSADQIARQMNRQRLAKWKRRAKGED